MVSLWPWKGDTSAETFEKALSALATKISKTAAKNDGLRQRSRRIKVMWTLYTVFAYILAAIILTLVTGYQNWGPVEYTAVAGGPLVIYAVRRGLAAYYDYRISNTQRYLESLYKERDETIERLKAATKYNSTQQLLEKYGSVSQPAGSSKPPSPELKRRSTGGRKTSQPQPAAGRTNIAPPPTANIPRNQHTPSYPGGAAPPPPLPQQPSTYPPSSPPQSNPPYPAQDIMPTAEFAPNAFGPDVHPAPAPAYSTSAPNSSQGGGGGQWYDRILDVLLGEDETQPKNRLALICTHCRLVNGQAPPGTKSLEDVGRWRCFSCGGWNGQEAESRRLVEEVMGVEKGGSVDVDAGVGDGSGMDVEDGEESGEVSEGVGGEVGEQEAPVAETEMAGRVTRSKGMGKRK